MTETKERGIIAGAITALVVTLIVGGWFIVTWAGPDIIPPATTTTTTLPADYVECFDRTVWDMVVHQRDLVTSEFIAERQCAFWLLEGTP
jgi:hypothetical protein